MSTFREFSRPTPNLTPGLNAALGVVLHHSVMDFAPAIERLTDPASVMLERRIAALGPAASQNHSAAHYSPERQPHRTG